MRTERFEFPAADGHALAGRLELPDGPARAYAVFAHCFTCGKDQTSAVRISRALAARGIGVLRFDFTGLGDSDGEFAQSHFSANVSDLMSAAEVMRVRNMPVSLLVGHSLGGAAVLAAAGRIDGIRAVATLGAPFDVAHVSKMLQGGLAEVEARGEAMVDLGGRPFRVNKAFVDDLFHHDQGARIAALHSAILVLHAPTDMIVGIDNAADIFQHARRSRSFVSLDSADHLLSKAADADYAAGVIAAWAMRYLAVAEAETPVVDPDWVTVEETGIGKYQQRVSAMGAVFIADEPVAVGGLGSGPGPYEVVSAGLGCCTAMTMKMYADRKAIPMTGARVQVRHFKDDSQTPPKDVFERKILLKGDLTDEQRASLIAIANKCPVHRTLEAGSQVRTEEVTG